MKFYVTIAEFETGIVLHTDGRRSLDGMPPKTEFEDLHSALEFASNHRADNPDHECVISDSDGQEVQILRPELRRQATSTAPTKPWWKFWS
ncbi:MAG: hypothetical protein IAE77_17105 [Prosthecobacter sp.]|jgi:hypothetical protein|uniref:hypothetical protein n=1 Tax=Prosthecobacter sp. TaxID=1965333 RepID=UPI0019D9629E|nr:hypothetical protein [Prosthecobacter sp.]MBE2285181.1 hypothetical protein [Prosthecobacter sp.]